MRGTLDCIPCLVRQAVDISRKVFSDDGERQQWIKRSLSFLSEQDFLGTTPPDLAAEFALSIPGREEGFDPYSEIKESFNRLILSLEERLRERIRSSADPLKEALVLAITGNIIDFGTPHGVTEESVLKSVDRAEHTPLVRDDTRELFRRLEGAESLLYLGDNCGEIVFDRLFIEQLKKSYPALEITFAVRGEPVLNDITLADAEQTGMDRIVPVIGNGDYAPGTRLERVSPEFRDAFDRAGVIISKGQGNLETLDGVRGRDLFFLFMVKCPVVSRLTGAPQGSLMCMKGG